MGLRPSSRLTSSPLVSFPSCSPPFLPRPLLLVHRPLLSFSISLSSSSGTLRLPPTTRHRSHPRFWRHQAPLALQRPPPKGGSPSRWPSLGMLRLGRPLSCRSIGLVCSLDRTVATPTTSASQRRPPLDVLGGGPLQSACSALVDRFCAGHLIIPSLPLLLPPRKRLGTHQRRPATQTQPQALPIFSLTLSTLTTTR
jgi:hypothetical protein